MTDVMRFLRDHRYAIVRPEVLGLPATTGRTAWVLDRAESGFREALLMGDEDLARQILFDLWLAKHELTTILDGVVTKGTLNLYLAFFATIAALITPEVRRFLRLPVTPESRENGKIMLVALLSSLLLWVVLLLGYSIFIQFDFPAGVLPATSRDDVKTTGSASVPWTSRTPLTIRQRLASALVYSNWITVPASIESVAPAETVTSLVMM